MNKLFLIVPSALLVAAALMLQPSHAASGGPDHTQADARAAQVARGSYIANSAGCADCHTPKKLGPNGPEPDLEHAFSGHPEGLVMPPAPELPPGPWMVTAAGTLTAWSGPWGVSFTANLTPDAETGLGKWTEETFLSTIRSGRHMGRGRQILPPMPIDQLNNLTDDDLRAVFAYLQSLPAVKNRVPAPIAPAVAR